jgi:hypothetical protein
MGAKLAIIGVRTNNKATPAAVGLQDRRAPTESRAQGLALQRNHRAAAHPGASAFSLESLDKMEWRE